MADNQQDNSSGGKPSGGGDQKADAQAVNDKNAAAKKKRNPIVFVIAGAVVLLLVVVVVWNWLATNGLESTDDAFTDGNAIAIAPQISGRVMSLDITDNEYVRAGQPLLHIDPRQFLHDREEALANLATAKAQLAGQKLGAEIARKNYPAQLASARADLVSAEASLDQRKADFGRQQSLSKAATTQQAFDSAKSAFEQAQAQVMQARARVTQATPVKQNIGQADSRISELGGNVAQAQAKLDQADLNLSYTVVKAEHDGWITKRNVDAGNYVTTGQQVLSIVCPEVWITANFKESQLKRMRRGQPVKIKIDAYPKLDVRGHVDSVQLGSGSKFSAFPPENATGNYVKIVERVPVKIIIDSGLDPHTPLPQGLSVEPSVRVK